MNRITRKAATARRMTAAPIFSHLHGPAFSRQDFKGHISDMFNLLFQKSTAG
jgi:hypothetical protein